MQTVDVITEITINRPLAEVARFASEPDNATKWYENIKAVEWKSPKPLRVGSLIAFRAEFLWKKLEYVYEVAENIENEKFVMRTADGPFPMETTYSWESMGENETRMWLRNRGNPSGFFSLFAPFMSMMMRSENRKDLKRLKSVLEKGNSQ